MWGEEHALILFRHCTIIAHTHVVSIHTGSCLCLRLRLHLPPPSPHFFSYFDIVRGCADVSVACLLFSCCAVGTVWSPDDEIWWLPPPNWNVHQLPNQRARAKHYHFTGKDEVRMQPKGYMLQLKRWNMFYTIKAIVYTEEKYVCPPLQRSLALVIIIKIKNQERRRKGSY